MPLMNAYATPAYQGAESGAPQGYVDVGFDYVYNLASLGAGASLTGQAVSLDKDADFVWRLVLINTNTLSVRFRDANGYYLSNDFILAANLDTVVFPELLFPAGGQIGLDLRDSGGGTTGLQIVFRGAKRYRL